MLPAPRVYPWHMDRRRVQSSVNLRLGMIALAAAGAVILLSCADDSQDKGDLPPFYLEAGLSSIDYSRTVGTSISGQSPGRPERRESIIRWWGEDRDHARFEFEPVVAALDLGTRVIVADGSSLWFYDEGANTFTKTPLPPSPPDVRARTFAFSLFFGPWPSGAQTAEEVVAELKAMGRTGQASVVGQETILGRDTTIIEFGATRTAGASQSHPPMSGHAAPKEEDHGTARIYLDVARMFVLAYETKDAVQVIDLRATRFDYDTKIPPARLRFTPPAGAQEVGDANGNAVGGGGGLAALPGGSLQYTVPAGFFGPSSLPFGYRAVRTETGTAGDGATLTFELGFSDDNGAVLILTERRRSGGLAPSLAYGEPVVVHGVAAYFLAGNENTLTWYETGIALRLTSASLGREELLRIAEQVRQ